MLNRIHTDVAEILRLERLISAAQTEDEVNDLNAERRSLRGRSVIATLAYSFLDIHRRHPLLFPIIIASFALKVFW